jgi:hypothetical protein
MEDLKAALIKSTQQDVDVLAQKLLDAVSWECAEVVSYTSLQRLLVEKLS